MPEGRGHADLKGVFWKVIFPQHCVGDRIDTPSDACCTASASLPKVGLHVLLDQHPRLPKVVRFPQLERQERREGVRREQEEEGGGGGEGDGAL